MIDFGDAIVAGTVLVRSAIQSVNYVAGSTGWTINQDGSAEFGNVTVRGTFQADGTYGSYIRLINSSGGSPYAYFAPGTYHDGTTPSLETAYIQAQSADSSETGDGTYRGIFRIQGPGHTGSFGQPASILLVSGARGVNPNNSFITLNGAATTATGTLTSSGAFTASSTATIAGAVTAASSVAVSGALTSPTTLVTSFATLGTVNSSNFTITGGDAEVQTRHGGEEIWLRFLVPCTATITETSGNIPDTVIFTLNDGFKPKQPCLFIFDNGSAGGMGVISTAGVMTMRSSSGTISSGTNVTAYATYLATP